MRLIDGKLLVLATGVARFKVTTGHGDCHAIASLGSVGQGGWRGGSGLECTPQTALPMRR